MECKSWDKRVGDENTENTPFLWPGRNKVEVNTKAHIIKALLYAIQNFYAFMIMWVPYFSLFDLDSD